MRQPHPNKAKTNTTRNAGPMTDKRLIEVDFPLKQTSLDSVHEKMSATATSPPCTSGRRADPSPPHAPP